MDFIKKRSLNRFSLISIIGATLAVTLLAVGNNVNPRTRLTGGDDGGVNQIVMHKDNGPTEEEIFTYVEKHRIRYVDFDYFGVQNDDDYHVLLAENGFIANNRDTRLTSITSITVTYDAPSPMKLALSNRNDGLGLMDKVEIASGVEFLPQNYPYHFRLYAGDVVTKVSRVEIHYTCVEQDPEAHFIDNLSKQYTGNLGGVVFSVTRDGIDATLETINLANNIVLDDGELSFDGDELKIEATGLTYIGTVSDNYHTITYKSATGPYAGSVDGLNLNAVYNLEDYESYSETGLGIRRSENGMYGHTHLRGAYYADYYSGNNQYPSPLGGNNWSLMGSTDYLDLTNDAHTGTKAGKYKQSTAGGMRYISWDLYTGTATIVGKGDTFSFWAKGIAVDALIKPRIAHVPRIHAGNQSSSSDTTTADITIPANSPWTQYTVALNPAKPVYGFQLYLNPGTQGYVPIDDIQVYTYANPWEEAFISVTGITVAPKTATIEVGKTTNLTATVAPVDASNPKVIWSSSDESVATVNEDGRVTAVDEGVATITAKTEDGDFTDTATITVELPFIDPDVPLTKTFSADTNLQPSGKAFILFAFTENNEVFITIDSSEKYEAMSTYTVANNVVTIDIDTNESPSIYGTFIGQFNESRTTLTKTSISGPAGQAIGTLVLDAAFVLEDANDTTDAALQDKYLIEYGGWTPSPSADRMTYSTSDPAPIEGSGYAKLKVGSFGKMRYKTKDMSQSLGTYKNIGLWFYNNTGYALTGQMFVYGLNGSTYTEIVTFSLPSNGEWTYYNCGFTQSEVYGWSIILPKTDGTAYPSIDYVTLF